MDGEHLPLLTGAIYTYVKSPVASLCFACSSVRNLVRVTISVLIFSVCTPLPLPLLFAAMMCWMRDGCATGE